MSRLARLLTSRPTKSLLVPDARIQRNGDSTFMRLRSSFRAEREEIESSFESYVDRAYKANGIVFACTLARMLPFSEARFQFQELRDGRPGRLFDGSGLRLLEQPWENGTTGDLLARMETDGGLGGNFFATVRHGRVRRLRPDWVTILSGSKADPDASAWDLDAEVLGYIYHPRGVGRPVDPVLLSPANVVHFAPIPDPLAQWRGMSWLTPVLREIEGDQATTKHKLQFFRRGAQIAHVVSYDKDVSPEDFEKYVAMFEAKHEGVENAYRTLHIGGGADMKVTTADLKQLDFKATQGAGETRIAAAAGVGAIIAQFSEGLAGSALNAGNYSAAKRRFGDMFMRPQWRMAAGALAKIATPPADARLWYDDRDVEFLKEDRKDAAEILGKEAETIGRLVDSGYMPDAVIDAVAAGDLTRLTGRHSGLFSVQLQAPVAGQLPPAPPAPTAETDDDVKALNADFAALAARLNEEAS